MRTLAFAHLDGELDRLEDLERVVAEERAELVVFAGSARADHRDADPEAPRSLHRVLHVLARLPCPVAVIPGEHDWPERHVMPVLTGQEWSERHLHSVHGSFASVRTLSVAGFGGQVTERERETDAALRYPGWEVRYRLAFLADLDQDLLLVFHHPPAQVRELDLVDGNHTGSETVTELIGTWDPKVAVVAGARPGSEVYGKTLVVSPGRFAAGR
jgi:uncharacterized protein